MEKMTKKELFERVIAIVKEANVEDEAILVDKLNHEIELVSKKRTSLTKNQKANIELADRILEVMKGLNKEVTVTEIYNASKDIEGITSPNKVSALVKKLKEAGKVEKIEDGKKSLFKVIAE